MVREAIEISCVLLREAKARAASAGRAAPVVSFPSVAMPKYKPGLFYFGGPVISRVRVWAVNWGREVDPMVSQDVVDLYRTIVDSPYLDALAEYSTRGLIGAADGSPGSDQIIGRGEFAGAVTIDPAPLPPGRRFLDDSDIQAELLRQIRSGLLPPPELDENGYVNSLYMVDVPAGIRVSDFLWFSCEDFCAYHASFPMDGMNVPYAVHPDCGRSCDLRVVHSHELTEAVTDPVAGTVWPPQAPTAWTDDTGQEIADICEDDGPGYLAAIWSNARKGCFVAP